MRLTLLILLSVLVPPATLAQPRTPPPCTHYAAPSGGGSVCSESSPCTISTWLQGKAQPGGVLCLKNGTYRGEHSIIDIPESFAGTAERPIVLRALTPGKVLIDGQDSLRPINTRGRYGIISGIDACCGDNQNVQIRGDHWLIRDLMTWNVGTDGDANVNMSGTDNTVEDCGSWGIARKPIAMGAAGGDRNTISRCWARWEGNEHPTSNPSVTIEGGYGQNSFTFQNTIAFWNRQGRQTEPEGAGEMFSSKDSKWLGSLFVIQHTDDYAPNTVFAAYADAGSQAQQGQFNPLTNLVFRHNVAFIDPRHPGFSSRKGFLFMEGTDGGPPGTNNTVSHLVSVSGQQSTFSSPSFPTSNLQWGTSLAAAIGQGKSLWTDSVAAPGICKRYVNGQLSDTGLWPWPMNQRIKDGLAQSGYPAVDVTATMESLFGAIPAACRTAGPGPGPGPNPPPTVPVPPTNVTATVQASQVIVAWTDTQNTIQTGYAVERATGPAGYVPLAAAIGRDERSFADTQPVLGQTNCYVIYARGPAGPSGFSEPACVAVPQTPRPPEPPAGATPLGCVGLQGDGGGIAIACMPQTPEGRR